MVAPLLAPDVPVVTWWPDEAPSSPSADPLGELARRRVTDAAASEEPRDMLLTLAKVYQPGDTDLSWTRATSWRSLLAATLDQPYPELLSGEVLAEPDNPSADLIAAWLELRLGIEVQRGQSGGPGITEVGFETADGKVALSRPDGRNATLSWPGRPGAPVALHRREAADLIAEELRRSSRTWSTPRRCAPWPQAREAPLSERAIPKRAKGARRRLDRSLSPQTHPRGDEGATREDGALRAPRRRARGRTMSVPEVIVHRDAKLLAQAVAARLVTRLVDAVAARGTASVVLTRWRHRHCGARRTGRRPGPGRH